MSTLKELILERGEFTSLLVRNLAIQIIEKFTEDNNGVNSEDEFNSCCKYRLHDISFKYYPADSINSNNLECKINNHIYLLRFYDIATSFGKYYEDEKDRCNEFKKIINSKIDLY